MSEELRGTGISPELVANSILHRAFTEHIDITPMKLQKLLFFTTCLYQRDTGCRLLTESFQPWRYGPVCQSVYDEFRGFGGNPITRYAQDAIGRVYVADEDSSPALRHALDLIWNGMKHLSAVTLSRQTHAQNGAWAQAIADGSRFISGTVMAHDHTFDDLLGL